MTEATTLLHHAYTAFNQRNIDAALTLMTEDVHWPKASEGGLVIGKDEIRAYWTRQWQEFDPHVEPLVITEAPDGRFRVRVHQLVRSLDGAVLFDGEVLHIFTLDGDRIAAMELGDTPDAADGPSAAFAHRA